MEIIPMAHQEDYKKILAYINAYKNGVTSDALKAYGVDYKKNFGVSMVDLKRVAERFTNSHQLANLLWKKEWRETYLLSTLLDTAEAYDIDTLSERVEQSSTYELLEQLAYNVAWKLSFLDNYFASISSWTLHKQYFLIKCTTYQVMKKKLSNAEAWERIQNFSFDDNASLLSILQNLLLRISTTDSEIHNEIVYFCKEKNTDTWNTLSEVIKEYGGVSA